MRIKSLREQIAEQLPQDDVERLMRMRMEHAMREMWYLRACMAHDIAPYHGVNKAATAKRRARNKVARKQRAINRGK